MKNIFYALIAISMFVSCNEAPSAEKTAEMTKPAIDYPDALDKVFDHHGTLAKWQKMKSLSYEIVKEGGNETQMIDLHTRAERIENSKYTSGFDGEKYWIDADTSVEESVKFYTNLIFYFYAMPFVLADDGIIYSEAPPLSYEGVDYPGYRIAYNDGVGVSPEDEYFIHYNPETYQMEWLGFTVTYFSGEKSDRISWRRYPDWQDINGLKLPTSMVSCKAEDGKITEIGKATQFVNAKISESGFPAGKLAMKEGALEVK